MIALSGADVANRRVACLRVWCKTEREADRVHRVADRHNLENPKRHLCNHAELAYLCGKNARAYAQQLCAYARGHGSCMALFVCV
jgi:hypothetical protein